MSDTTIDDFRVGAVLGRSFSTYFRNFVAFVALALVLNAPIYVYQLIGDPGASLATGGVPVGTAGLDAGQHLELELFRAPEERTAEEHRTAGSGDPGLRSIKGPCRVTVRDRR